MLNRLVFLTLLLAGVLVAKEMADGCGMNPLMALVAVADKTNQSVENLMGKFSADKMAFREFVMLLGRYESCIRVGSGTRYRKRSPEQQVADLIGLL
ncbi:hypothetical protein RvY_14861 [Ramazzottius varieornatus]|uniref:Uncharacterized protein n=1 Tax=Ramazzottius varieornatus TaxID=947166 RepID=A0A1D1W141_RAMVA|nr:hypothetical protein RvY_14861 [Ramazzottius varieornatus]